MAPVKFLVALFLLVIDFLTIPQAIAVTCDNEQRIDGTLDSVSIDPLDSQSGDVIVDGLTLTVDPYIILNNANGDRITLSAFQPGEPVRARFCPDTPPQPTAVRIDQLTGAPANPPDLLSLDVVPGTESQPVLRVYGDDSADHLGAGITDGIAFGDVNGDGFDDMVIGSPSANSPAGFTVGVVLVIYGSSDLPASSVDLNTDGVISAAGETRILAATVTFRYTDAELGTADERRLVVFASSTGAADSWVIAGNPQQQDLLRNEITVIGIDSFSLFIIAEADLNVDPAAVDLSGTIRPTEGLRHLCNGVGQWAIHVLLCWFGQLCPGYPAGCQRAVQAAGLCRWFRTDDPDV